MTDAQTVAKAQAGDRKALDLLLRQQIAGIHAALHRLLGADPELEDLVQRTLIEVASGLPGFRGESRLETWIHRIAVRVAYAHLRSRRNVVSLEALPDLTAATEGPAAMEARAALTLLRRCVARLSPERRMAFLLHDVEGFTAREISGLLAVPEGTLHSRLHEARAQIRAALSKDQPRAPLKADAR